MGSRGGPEGGSEGGPEAQVSDQVRYFWALFRVAPWLCLPRSGGRVGTVFQAPPPRRPLAAPAPHTATTHRRRVNPPLELTVP
eukprot:5673552-Pyramimonas_sp.AAC.1